MESNNFIKAKSLLLELSKKERADLVNLIIDMDGGYKANVSKKDDTDLHLFYLTAKNYFKGLPATLSILKKSSPKNYNKLKDSLEVVKDFCSNLERSYKKDTGKHLKLKRTHKQVIYNLFFKSIKNYFEKMDIPFLFSTCLNHKNNFQQYLELFFPGYSSSAIFCSLVLSV